MPTIRIASQAPGARFTTYAVTVENGVVLKCECKGWRFHRKCKHAAMALDACEPVLSPCTCPAWDHPDDFDGPDDYARACAPCPVHN